MTSDQGPIYHQWEVRLQIMSSHLAQQGDNIDV